MYNRFIDALSQYGLVYIQNIFVLWTLTVKKMAIWEFFLHEWWELKPSFTEWVTLILEISQIYFIIKHHLRLTDDKLYTQHFFCGKYLIPGFKIFLHWLYSEKKNYHELYFHSIFIWIIYTWHKFIINK